MLCSRPSFLRKQESSLPTPDLWMPDHVRHDEDGAMWLQLIVNRSSDAVSHGVGSDQWKSICENLRELTSIGDSDGDTTS